MKLRWVALLLVITALTSYRMDREPHDRIIIEWRDGKPNVSVEAPIRDWFCRNEPAPTSFACRTGLLIDAQRALEEESRVKLSYNTHFASDKKPLVVTGMKITRKP